MHDPPASWGRAFSLATQRLLDNSPPGSSYCSVPVVRPEVCWAVVGVLLATGFFFGAISVIVRAWEGLGGDRRNGDRWGLRRGKEEEVRRGGAGGRGRADGCGKGACLMQGSTEKFSVMENEDCCLGVLTNATSKIITTQQPCQKKIEWLY